MKIKKSASINDKKRFRISTWMYKKPLQKYQEYALT